MHNATETDFYFKGLGNDDGENGNGEGTDGETVETLRGGITERYSGYVSDYEKAQRKSAIDGGPEDKANLPDGVIRAVTPAEKLRFFGGVARTTLEHPRGRSVDFQPLDAVMHPDAQIFMSEVDGLTVAGAMVTPDGELTAVFRHPDAPKGTDSKKAISAAASRGTHVRLEQGGEGGTGGAPGYLITCFSIPANFRVP